MKRDSTLAVEKQLEASVQSTSWCQSQIIDQALKLWWVAPIVLAAVVINTAWFKGLWGEALVKASARLGLPQDSYHAIHNVTLQTPDGTTQIDHIFVSRFGIFVVETKHMKGWIFGDESQAQWTQRIFRESFRFQNPLRQNYKHVKALESALDAPANQIHSVVVFTGSCVLKTAMPANVTKGIGYLRYIKSFREPILSDAAVKNAVSQIQQGRLAATRETHRQHVRSLRRRVDPSASRQCPRCGSSMVLRTAKSGANAGEKFWGCSAYPKCRAVRKVD